MSSLNAKEYLACSDNPVDFGGEPNEEGHRDEFQGWKVPIDADLLNLGEDYRFIASIFDGKLCHGNPPRYTDAFGEALPFQVSYQRLLHPTAANNSAGGCQNSRMAKDLFQRDESQNGREDFTIYLDTVVHWIKTYETGRTGILHQIFTLARSTLLRRCHCSSADFVHMMPPCPTWPGFSEWVAQLVACGSGLSRGILRFPVEPSSWYFFGIADRISEPVTGADQHRHRHALGSEPDDEYLRWEESIDFHEVFTLISWLSGFLFKVQSQQHYLMPNPAFARELAPRVPIALNQATKLGLCLYRVWALAANTSGQEISLLTLIPSIDNPPSEWRHFGHEECTPDYCYQLNLNFTSVQQLHVCSGSSDNCRKTEGLFRHDQLMEAVALQSSSVERFIPTAWALDGLSIIKPSQPFLAISHVWSDGTGNGTWPRGIVNQCLFDLFCSIARELGCEGIWWDTICLPTEPKARMQAINRMHENYAYASTTLIHDRYLSTMQWHSRAAACFSLIMSPWFTRGWTALELAKAGNVHVLFSNNGQPLLRSLHDIIARKGEVTHRYHFMASTHIVKLRRPINDLNDLLTALGPRYTSWATDKAIIAGLLVGVENPASMSQPEIYQEILKSIRGVAFGNLFHGLTTMSSGPFQWCPTDIFRMPRTVDKFENDFEVNHDGSLSGVVKFVCLSHCAERMDIHPADTHPLLRVRTELALMDRRANLLILDFHDDTDTRGLLIKLKSWPRPADPKEDWPKGELVGAVILRKHQGSPPLEPLGSVWFDIRSGHDIPDIPKGTSSCSFLKTFGTWYHKITSFSCAC